MVRPLKKKNIIAKLYTIMHNIPNIRKRHCFTHRSLDTYHQPSFLAYLPARSLWGNSARDEEAAEAKNKALRNFLRLFWRILPGFKIL